METEYCGKFFVWTKKGRRPRFSHDTRELALKEAKRLAFLNPGRKFIVQQFLEKVSVEPESHVGRQKESIMKTLWYGAKDNDVRFADTENALKEHGINNPQSFTVSGEVEGLQLIGTTTSQSSGQQAVG